MIDLSWSEFVCSCMSQGCSTPPPSLSLTHSLSLPPPPVHPLPSLFRYTELPEEEYRCPVLQGCTVCVTGLSTVERKEVQRLCQEHGGSYTGQLKMNECTHLIVSEPSGNSTPDIPLVFI